MELSQITFDFNDMDSEKVPEKKLNNKRSSPSLKEQKAMKPPSQRGRKSLKETEINTIVIPDDEILFKKLYYSIGEVSAMFNENASLLRYWENEFDIIQPKKNAKGDRHFRPDDIKNLKLIHHLLRERKYTIEGAKEFLKNNRTAGEKYAMIQSLTKLKSFLLELKASL